MSDEPGYLQEMITKLKQERDELAVQIHLGKAEAKEEWDKLTEKLDNLLAEYEPLQDAISETAENVVSGMSLVSQEILAGFKRIKNSL